MNKKENEMICVKLNRSEVRELMFFVSAVRASVDILHSIIKPIYDSSDKLCKPEDVKNDD